MARFNEWSASSRCVCQGTACATCVGTKGHWTLYPKCLSQATQGKMTKYCKVLIWFKPVLCDKTAAWQVSPLPAQDPHEMKAHCLNSCCHPTCGCCPCPIWWCLGWRLPAPTGVSCSSFRTKDTLHLLVWRRTPFPFMLRKTGMWSGESLFSSSQAAHS